MNNAYEIPNLRFSLLAGADIPRRRFVGVNASGEGVIAAAAGPAIGVSMNEAAAGEVLEVADGIVMVEAGADVVAGVAVQSDDNGRAITLADGTKVGVALSSAAAAGVLVAVKI